MSNNCILFELPVSWILNSFSLSLSALLKLNWAKSRCTVYCWECTQNALAWGKVGGSKGEEKMCGYQNEARSRIIFAVEKQQVLYIVFVYVCVRTCVCPGEWTCACMCMSVALLIQHTTGMCHIVTSFVASLIPPYFSTLSHQRRNFRKKVTEHKNLCFIQLLFKKFLF